MNKPEPMIDDKWAVLEREAARTLDGLSPRAQAVAALAIAMGVHSWNGAVEVKTLKSALSISDAEWLLLRRELYDTATALVENEGGIETLKCDGVESFARYALGTSGRPSPSEWERLRKYVFGHHSFGGRDRLSCTYCYSFDDSMTLDHIHPIKRGGSNHPLNLFPACRNCNARKGAMPWAKWVEVFERLRKGRA